MREVTRELFGVWLKWTVVLAVGVGVVALTEPGLTVLAAIGAGLLSLTLLSRAFGAWKAIASYRWFWWWR
jgi:hypothetical protein